MVVSLLIIFGLLHNQFAQAANILFTIITDKGSLVITSQNSTFGIVGKNGINSSVSSGSIIISNNRISSFGVLTRIQYQGQEGKVYFSDQMTIKGSYNTDVLNSELFNGTLISSDIIPITNTLQSPIVFTLYVNDVTTNKTIIIQPGKYDVSMVTLNINFKKMDHVYWIASSNDNSNNYFLANVRVLMHFSDP